MDADIFLARLLELSSSVMMAFFLFLFGRLFHSLTEMKKLADRTWMKALSDFLVALFGIIGVGAVMIFAPFR